MPADARDVTGDGVISAEDLEQFKAWFTARDIRADFDGNGTVQDKDLSDYTAAYTGDGDDWWGGEPPAHGCGGGAGGVSGAEPGV